MRPAVPKLIALALAVVAPLRAQEPLELRIMSFNIRYGAANDGVNAWPSRRDQLVALLQREASDVIGVQEGLYLQLGEIRARLPGYGGIGVGRDDGVLAGEFSAILYRTERFDIVTSGTFWFSDTPEVPGSRSWGNNVTRICTWAHLREKATNRRFWIYNVHLDHESQPSRERSVALLLERIRTRGDDDPVVVTGDFNAGEDNPAVVAMRAAGFRDTYRAVHPGDSIVGTFHAFRGDSTGAKIDYIFAEPRAGARTASIVRDHVGGRYPSDHFPVTAVLPPLARLFEPPDVVAMDAITVTATRIERRVEDQPLRVEVVGREEIEEKLAMTPGDVAMLLNETGGLRVTTTAPSMGSASVRVHGLSGRYTQMLADGLPLHGPTSSLGLLQIPPMDLAQVEIVKGPASAMYGGGGLGGLINFVSRRPAGQRELLLNATTLGGADGVLFASGGTPRSGWTLLAGAHRQGRADRDDDGWTDVAGYTRGVIRPRLFLDNGSGSSLFATLGLTVENREGGTLPGDTAPDGLPFGEALETRRVDGGMAARWHTVSGLHWAARAAGMVQTHAQTFGAERDEDRHATLFGEVTLTRPGTRVTWLAGLAAQGEDFHSDSVSRLDYAHTAPAAFAHVEWTPGERFALSISARAERHNVYGWQLNPRASGLLRFAPGWTARLTAGTGYVAPTPFTEETEEVGLRRLVLQSPLRAEHAQSLAWDLGGVFGPWELNATIFGTRIERPVEALVWFGGSPQPDSLQLVNAAEPMTALGLDVVARWARGPLRITATSTWLRSRRDGPLAGRRAVALNPRHAVGAVGAWERGPTRVGVEVYYTGRQALEDNAYRAESPDYVVVGALIQREVGRTRVFLNLENLTDARVTRHHPLVNPFYFGTTGWTSAAWGPLEGRVINGGARVAF